MTLLVGILLLVTALFGGVLLVLELRERRHDREAERYRVSADFVPGPRHVWNRDGFRCLNCGRSAVELQGELDPWKRRQPKGAV